MTYRAYRTAHMRRCRHERARRGLCTECPRRPEPGRTKCTQHLAQQRDATRRWLARSGRAA